MPKFRDIVVGLVVASLLENVAINRLAPELLLADRFSRSILRFFLINLFLYTTYDLFIRPFFISPLRHLPGPSDTGFLGETRTEGVYREPGKTFLDWNKTVPNNGVIRFRGLLNRDRLLLTSEEALRAVLGEHSYDYVKPEPIRNFLAQILGVGLIIAEGDEHKFQRKHVTPVFQLKQLRNLYPIFWEKSRQLIEILESEMKDVGPTGSIEFGIWATRVTLDIIGVAGMGRDFHSLKNSDDELVEAYNELLEPSKQNGAFFAVNVILGSRLVKMIPWHLNEKLGRITSTLSRYCLDLVADRKKELKAGKAEDRKDIITELIRSNDFKDSELGDQMLTFLAAGHETTSSAITWLCYLLCKNPKIQEELRAEIRAALPSPTDTTNIPAAADIEALELLNGVCNETLRLYPTVPVTIREAIRPSIIPLHAATGGQETVHVPKGTRILISPWATNRSPKIWGPDSEKFVPQRWIGEGKSQNAGQASNYSQITFLHGARSCIGQGFAKAELKCLAAAIIGRFEVTMADENHPVYPAGVVTIKPGQGMPLRFKRVEGW